MRRRVICFYSKKKLKREGEEIKESLADQMLKIQSCDVGKLRPPEQTRF